MTIVMEEGTFMIRLTVKTVRLYTVGIIELDVPISKFHHEQITMWLFYFRVE